MSPAIAPPEETAHEVVDEALPEEFEWERLVRTYPVPALGPRLRRGGGGEFRPYSPKRGRARG